MPERAELQRVPFFPQEDYACGPAALATSLGNLGIEVTPDELIGKVYIPARQGSLQIEMLAAARRYGAVSYRLAPTFDALLREIAAGSPVIVLQDYGVWPVSYWHYAVAVGYDRASGDLLLRSGEKRRLSIPFGVFEYTWKESGYWAMVTVSADRMPATATESDYLDAIVALERAGNTVAAGKAYATLLERWPGNLTAGIGRANALHAAGDLAGAEAVLRQAVASHPDSVAALNNLAQTVSDRGRNDEALVFIERARALGGELGQEVEDTRAQIVRRMRDVR